MDQAMFLSQPPATTVLLRSLRDRDLLEIESIRREGGVRFKDIKEAVDVADRGVGHWTAIPGKVLDIEFPETILDRNARWILTKSEGLPL